MRVISRLGRATRLIGSGPAGPAASREYAIGHFSCEDGRDAAAYETDKRSEFDRVGTLRQRLGMSASRRGPSRFRDRPFFPRLLRPPSRLVWRRLLAEAWLINGERGANRLS